jgi:hypothetical protein
MSVFFLLLLEVLVLTGDWVDMRLAGEAAPELVICLIAGLFRALLDTGLTPPNAVIVGLLPRCMFVLFTELLLLLLLMMVVVVLVLVALVVAELPSTIG